MNERIRESRISNAADAYCCNLGKWFTYLIVRDEVGRFDVTCEEP